MCQISQKQKNETKCSNQLLLNAGGNVLVVNHKKQSPLHAAAYYGSNEACKMLLDKSKQNINDADAEGFLFSFSFLFSIF